jgi:hypothetical protein
VCIFRTTTAVLTKELFQFGNFHVISVCGFRIGIPTMGEATEMCAPRAAAFSRSRALWARSWRTGAASLRIAACA